MATNTTSFPSVAPHPAPDGSGALTNLTDGDYYKFMGEVQRGHQSLPPPPDGAPQVDVAGQGNLLSGGTSSAATPSDSSSQTDTRIRLTALNPGDVFTGILSVLNNTNGMLFPYTPQISFTQTVNYMDLQLVHSNTDYAAYTRTPSVTVSINGKFTVQNQEEGQYALACLHFLRTASKSYFGLGDGDKAGLPPPILVLSGYGNYMFNQLRVILKSHNWSFDDTSDGIDVSIPASRSSSSQIASLGNDIPSNSGSGGMARLPSLFTVSCELAVVQTPKRMREEFSFDKFASGQLMQSSNVGWI